MKKLSFKYLIIMIVILLFFFSLFKITLRSKDGVIVSAFNESEAEILTSNILCQGTFEENINDIGQLKQIVQKILHNFDITSSSMTEGENYSDTILESWSYGRTKDDTYIKIVASSEKLKENNATINSISLVLSGNKFYKPFYEIEKEAVNIIKPYVSNVNLNSTITGTYSKELNKGDIDQIVDNILKSSQAIKVKTKHADSVLNISAYSPLYDNCVIIDDKKVNLNISIRYNSYENKTYISLSSPRVLDTLD